MKRLIVLSILVLMMLVMAGCGFLNVGNNTDSTGSLALFLADAPVNDVQNVFVTIDEVQVYNEENGWLTINDFTSDGGEKTFDLLTLRFDEDLLGQESLPVGTYTQIRLIVAANEELNGQGNYSGPNAGKSYIVLKDGTKKDIFIPSGTQTGLKINHTFTIEEGVITQLVLDTDVREMLHSAGKSGKIILRPTAIKVVDKVISGDVEGRVIDSGGNAITDVDVIVEALDASGNVVASTVATAEETILEDGTVKPAGSFKLRGLEEGTYWINAYAIDANGAVVYELSSELITVQVVAKQTTVLENDIILKPVLQEPAL
ncbi:hypothetical protein BBF96_14135 [Anoxybacter fermentans]|uniref:DUF4382 domain-containing protein n=1 Tax=Anoxybacter fermentans TaxID=1323375 RepID=A0A3Q9HS01_9FIRM|nr:DUF4382 domain-containing protein [Anoxybacter fermentans]AZR74426.1 hypothetical protein BBF96_14135 [Anoxybacter fermentans]